MCFIRDFTGLNRLCQRIADWDDFWNGSQPVQHANTQLLLCLYQEATIHVWLHWVYEQWYPSTSRDLPPAWLYDVLHSTEVSASQRGTGFSSGQHHLLLWTSALPEYPALLQALRHDEVANANANAHICCIFQIILLIYWFIGCFHFHLFFSSWKDSGLGDWKEVYRPHSHNSSFQHWRWGVNWYFLCQYSFHVHCDDVDINFHQGFDTYANHMKDRHESENDVYNRRFLVRPVRSCKDSHYKACSDNSIAKKC